MYFPMDNKLMDAGKGDSPRMDRVYSEATFVFKKREKFGGLNNVTSNA